LSAQAQVVFFCRDVIYDTFEHEPNDVKQMLKQRRAPDCADQAQDALRLGFADEEELKAAMTQEFFKQMVIPPVFRKACYYNNPVFCEYVDGSSIEDNSYLLTVLLYLWSPVITGLLIWRWTKPKEEDLLNGGGV